MSPVLYNDRRQTCCVVVLQNCVGFVEGQTCSCNEADVERDVGETEEFSFKVEEDIKEDVSIKVEDAIDIKDERPEAITFATIKTEQEVRLWGVCEVVAGHAFRPYMAPKRKQ